ncbi:MAG: aminotransferase class I/II-fold pyridoxal phosphate-dependent enzyme [Chitinophagales bacterium]|nr:aminotransferase class I/II-fold pyridoxal phosphate-dependent enzyme [Chitinophagales bacterium]
MNTDNIRNTHYKSICVKDPSIENNHGHIPPIYATSTFTYEDLDAAFAFFRGENKIPIYTRFGNPSVGFVAQKIADLEACDVDEVKEAKGLLFASGMAAISSALLSQLKSGDAVLCQAVTYGASSDLIHNSFKALGVESVDSDFKDMEKVKRIIQANPTIRVVYLETPANPTLSCVNIKAVADLAKQYDIKVIVDNTFATSYAQQPFRFGADIIVYSSTKFMNGHGTGLSGAVVVKNEEDFQKAYKIQKNFGGILSPFEAYLLNIGIKTLPLRMVQHQQNAQQLAEFLSFHPKIKKVNFLGLDSHPDQELAENQMFGPTGMMSFELEGGLDAGIKFQKNIKFCTRTASLGTTDTLVTHPASTSHSVVPRDKRLAIGITDGMIRSSVGIEYIEDIIADFAQALDAV